MVLVCQFVEKVAMKMWSCYEKISRARGFRSTEIVAEEFILLLQKKSCGK